MQVKNWIEQRTCHVWKRWYKSGRNTNIILLWGNCCPWQKRETTIEMQLLTSESLLQNLYLTKRSLWKPAMIWSLILNKEPKNRRAAQYGWFLGRWIQGAIGYIRNLSIETSIMMLIEKDTEICNPRPEKGWPKAKKWNNYISIETFVPGEKALSSQHRSVNYNSSEKIETALDRSRVTQLKPTTHISYRWLFWDRVVYRLVNIKKLLQEIIQSDRNLENNSGRSRCNDHDGVKIKKKLFEQMMIILIGDINSIIDSNVILVMLSMFRLEY